MKCGIRSSRFDRLLLGGPGRKTAVLGGLLLLLLVLAGCSSQRIAAGRPFSFGQDSSSFANELEWNYRTNAATGRLEHAPRRPPPAFRQRCFPLLLAVRQFYYHARFDPALARLDPGDTRRLVREVLSRSARRPSPPDGKIAVPGWADFFAFSQAQEGVLKEEMGGRWRSFFQRGNWRMVFPFSRAGKARAAGELAARVQGQQAPIIHVTTFPSLSINHGLLLYGAEEDAQGIRFLAYDPNTPAAPVCLTFERATGHFYLPPSAYFAGGQVKVYEVYRNVCF